MIQDKNISTRMISNKTLSNNKIIDIQLYLESTGIKDASEKVSKAYAEVGLSKDGMPSLDALIDPTNAFTDSQISESNYVTLGLRWDFHDSAALKFEYTSYSDDLNSNNDAGLFRTALVTVF